MQTIVINNKYYFNKWYWWINIEVWIWNLLKYEYVINSKYYLYDKNEYFDMYTRYKTS